MGGGFRAVEGVTDVLAGSRGESPSGSIRFDVGITKGASGLAGLAVFFGLKNPSSIGHAEEGMVVEECETPCLLTLL